MQAQTRDVAAVGEPVHELDATLISGAQTGAQLHGHGQPAAPGRRTGDRDRLVGIGEQRRAGAGLADLGHRAAHVDVDQVRSGGGNALGRGGHHVGVVAEQLDCRRARAPRPPPAARSAGWMRNSSVSVRSLR